MARANIEQAAVARFGAAATDSIETAALAADRPDPGGNGSVRPRRFHLRRE